MDAGFRFHEDDFQSTKTIAEYLFTTRKIEVYASAATLEAYPLSADFTGHVSITETQNPPRNISTTANTVRAEMPDLAASQKLETFTQEVLALAEYFFQFSR